MNLENILDVTPFACVLVAETFEVKYMNPIMSEFFSLDPALELSGAAFLSFIPEDEQEDFLAFIKRLGESRPTQNWRLFNILDLDGKKKPVLFNGMHNIRNLGAEGVYLLVGMPVIENLLENFGLGNLEENLRFRFSTKKYDSIIQSATIGITILDENGIVEDTNQTFLRQIGQEQKSVIKKHFTYIFNKESNKIISTLFNTIRDPSHILSKDIINLSLPDRSHRILEVSISKIDAVEDQTGKFMMITEDITNQKDTHAALLQSEKLALTGRLAASLAHEINNPLQTSLGCLGLAEEMLGEDNEDLRVYIEMAMEELQRSARIVKKLRDLNRKTDSSEKTPVNLQRILEGVLILTKNRLYDSDIVPIFPYQGPTPYVLGSEDQIQQVVLNLVMNAIDALPEGGNIYLDLVETKTPAGYEVKVRDTGKGISPEIMVNLFNPFFTTKEEGLGLGLYISKRIIEEHEGTMSVESEPGQGTAFTIWLPQLDVPETEE